MQHKQPHETRRDVTLELLRDFVGAVAGSSSSVSLMGLTDYGLSKIIEAAHDQKIIENFLKKFVRFLFWHFKDFAFIGDYFKRNCFPNLQRFDECCFPGSSDEVPTSDGFEFPRNIRCLSISSSLLLRHNFPQSLKYLHMNLMHCTTRELQETICRISDSCPLLEEMEFTWICKSPLSADDIIPKLKDKRIFPSKVVLSNCAPNFDINKFHIEISSSFLSH